MSTDKPPQDTTPKVIPFPPDFPKEEEFKQEALIAAKAMPALQLVEELFQTGSVRAREKSLVLTKIQEAQYWLSRYQDGVALQLERYSKIAAKTVTPERQPAEETAPAPETEPRVPHQGEFIPHTSDEAVEEVAGPTEAPGVPKGPVERHVESTLNPRETNSSALPPA